MQFKLPLLLMLAAVLGYGQNLQLHYDFGENRHYCTSTIEMYKPDQYGATFFFVDMDYDYPETNSMSLSYFEIARYVSLPQIEALSVTLQYNDGITASGSLGNVWLGGFSYPIQLGSFILNTDLLYRHDPISTAPDAQLTLVWFETLLHETFSFCGYLDIWTTGALNAKKIIIMSEPQLWYQVTPHLFLGGELEISWNFCSVSEWSYMPTLGLKWTF